MKRTLLALLSGAAAAAGPIALASKMPILRPVEADYLRHCGGCHGVQGVSAPARIPQLRNRVGYFLCTADSREYVLRLPNVALSSLDDRQLAATMNFVVFGLGGPSAPGNAPRFTAREVAAARRRPLTGGALVAVRAKLVATLEQRCGTPASLLRF